MNQLGEVLSVSYNENIINQLGDGDPRLKDFIQGLQSAKAGEKRRFSVPASRAYGPYDPRLSIKVNLKNKNLPIGNQIRIGSQIIYPQSNSSDAKVYRVVEKTAQHVVLEGNHPFAGIDLIFEIEIISARKANQTDLSQQNHHWLNENIH